MGRFRVALSATLVVIAGACGRAGGGASAPPVPAASTSSTSIEGTTASAPSASAASPNVADVATAPPPRPISVVDGVATYRYGPAAEHLLDVRLAPGSGPESAAPALVYLASGGWAASSRNSVPTFVSAQVEAGWAVVPVDFRLSPDHVHPAPSADVDRAIRWLRLHGEALGVDPRRIVLVGASSGGNLALLAAAAPGRFADPELEESLAGIEPVVAGVISVAGPGDLLAAYRGPTGWLQAAVEAHLGCVDGCADAALADASPVTMVEPGPPPLLAIFGELDTLVPAAGQGDVLAEAWDRAGGSASIVVASGFGHNLELGAGIDPEVLDAFLESAR